MPLGIQPGLPADIGQANNHEIKPKTHYERSGNDIIEKGLSTPIGTIVFDSEKRVAIILASADTGNQLNSLRSELEGKEKADFIEKLKQLSDYKGSKVESAIEKGTIEVKKIPGRDLYAIYESKTGNLVYITDLEGKKYFNLDRIRKGPLRGGLEVGYRKLSGVNEKIENGLYNLYRGNDKIPILSDEYLLIVLKSVDMLLQFEKDLEEEIKRREKEGIQ